MNENPNGFGNGKYLGVLTREHGHEVRIMIMVLNSHDHGVDVEDDAQESRVTRIYISVRNYM